ncbi:MAG: hypothetical protein HYS35_03580 [Betaproteobacteria bacterium]|nr:hypothetical protein [Betaproteobacteria bacterium]
MRVITYAWGEHYVDDLLTLTLPAVLAPGNLPTLASAMPCEFVLLTKNSHFDAIRSSGIFQRLQALCRARLVSIDDLVATGSAYGHSLTWTLYRSFEDLDDAVTETNLLFFHADWIPADGSYRALIKPLAAGERLVVSPSYCVRQEAVVPILRSRMTSGSEVLSVSPREMAALAIAHRHNTVRAKTINQTLFHMDVMDQFYSRVDETTMLGRQLPIAIVCMRPERRIDRPTTFWDYGTVREFCPTTVPRVLGDSDDFLMVELRSQATYSEGLDFGPHSRSEVVDKLASFTTKDHRDYGRHTLILHSADLPPGYAEARRQFDRYVDAILDELPPPLDHHGHPYWVGVSEFFNTIRVGYLHSRSAIDAPDGETRLAETAVANDAVNAIKNACVQHLQDFFSAAPFEDLNALETSRASWRNKHLELQRCIARAGHTVYMILAMHEGTMLELRKSIARTIDAVREAEHHIVSTNDVGNQPESACLNVARSCDLVSASYFAWLARSVDGAATTPSSESAYTAMAIREIQSEFANILHGFLTQTPFTQVRVQENARSAALASFADLQRRLADAGHTANIVEVILQRAVDRLRRNLEGAVAAVSDADQLVGSAKPAPSLGYGLAGSTEIRDRSMGGNSQANAPSKLASMFNPLYSALRPLLRVLQPHFGQTEQSILTVHSNRGGVARDLIASLPGRHYSVHVDALATPSALDGNSELRNMDLCICDFSADDAVRFREVHDRIRPYMRAGGKVILSAVNKRAGLRGFASHATASELIFGFCPPTDRLEIYYTGSYSAAMAIVFWFGVQAVGDRLGYRLPGLIVKLLGAPLSLLSYLREQFNPMCSGGRPPQPWISVIVCATV